ncbi:MAG TPA: PilZ domain-containing protein [Desulfatiglandales bacterium]|nr:PilZ domain-containing protein [Desulfatiglandales bacterium]
MTTFEIQSNESRITARLIELIKNMPEDEQRTLLKDLEEKPFEGRRKHVRKPFLMAVDYSTQDHIYKDFIQDISTGGVFIQTHMPFTVGQEVSLTFPLPNYQKHIKVTGEVVRSTTQGVGVKFKMADQDQTAMITSLLESI